MTSFNVRAALLISAILCAFAVAIGTPVTGALAQGTPVGGAFDSGCTVADSPPVTGDPVAPPGTTPGAVPAQPPVPVGAQPGGACPAPAQPTPPDPPAVAPTPVEAQSPEAPSAATAPGLRALDPFPVVRIRGRITRTGANISLLLVRAPVGAKVSLRCRGKACPTRRLARATTASALRLRSFERHLRAGTLVEVSVTQPGLIGKYARFRIRRLGAPVRTDLCLIPGQRIPRACS